MININQVNTITHKDSNTAIVIRTNSGNFIAHLSEIDFDLFLSAGENEKRFIACRYIDDWIEKKSEGLEKYINNGGRNWD